LGLLLFSSCLVSSIDVHGGHTLTPHLRGARHETQHGELHETQHETQHDNLPNVLVDVGAIVAAKVQTRLGVLIDRNLPDDEKAEVRTTLRDAVAFIPAVLAIVNAVDGIDDATAAVQNKVVDRAIFVTLKASFAAIYGKMRAFRMTWEPALDFATAPATYREFIKKVAPSIYLHVTVKTNAASVLANGLKPSNGGGDTGISQGSVAAVRALNVEAAAGKSYVTRSDAEVRDYYGNAGTKQVLMIYICHVCEDWKYLYLDPDSQHGLYYVQAGWTAGLGKAVATKTAGNEKFIEYVQNLVREDEAMLDDFNAAQDTYITQLHTFLISNRD